MAIKAKTDFQSISLNKKFKAGDDLSKEKKELTTQWINVGVAEEVKESKTGKNRKTK